VKNIRIVKQSLLLGSHTKGKKEKDPNFNNSARNAKKLRKKTCTEKAAIVQKSQLLFEDERSAAAEF
jgi:hypothetical protein